MEDISTRMEHWQTFKFLGWALNTDRWYLSLDARNREQMAELR